jgi:hypothetical protein
LNNSEYAIHFGDISPIYYWDDTSLILYTVNHDFYLANDQGLLSKVEPDNIKEAFPFYYEYAMKAKPYIYRTNVEARIFSADQYSYQFTYGIYGTKEICFVDCKNNRRFSAQFDSNDMHSVIYHENSFIVVNCNSVKLVYDNQITVLISATENQEFLKAALSFDKKILAILSREWKNDEFKILLSLYNVCYR